MARTAGRDWFSPCVITASSCWLWSPLVEIGAVRPARPPGAGRPLLDQGEEPVRSRRERRQHDRWRAGPLRLSFSRSAASPAIWARVRACSEAPGDNARPIGSPTLRTSPKWTSVELPSCWSASDLAGIHGDDLGRLREFVRLQYGISRTKSWLMSWRRPPHRHGTSRSVSFSGRRASGLI